MFFFDKIQPLPLHLLGLKNLPGVPVVVDQWLSTLVRLGEREIQTRPAKNGLTETYTIGGNTATGHAFLFGGTPTNALADARDALAQELKAHPMLAAAKLFAKSSLGADQPSVPAGHPLTRLFLDDPAQFSISWTTFLNIYRDARPLLPGLSATLTDPAAAAKAFWPTLSTYGLPYNLLILQKISAAQVPALRTKFAATWTPAFDALVARGALYAIDLSLFTTLKPNVVDGFTRFTPATITLLSQDQATKDLTPIAVRVSGYQDAGAQVFAPGAATDSAWLYALQAAKTSATLYGIWLGHVYHWHLVTAAMQMTMYNHLAKDSALYQLIEPQSDYLMAFDNVLLLLWEFGAPPTSVTSAAQFLELCNTFADGRDFFDDDPLETLRRNGLNEADFTVSTPWDKYPIVARLLTVWRATADYVDAFVTTSYPTDASVAQDAPLQAWMAAAAKPDDGNIRGLPAMITREALGRVLTSLLYRVTMHGCARVPQVASPGLAFVANFPPCLQDATIPAPDASFDTRGLLRYLPNTGTLGGMVTFYYTFGFSIPYESFVPQNGIEADLFFPGGLADPRNQALVRFRQAIIAMNTELSSPAAPQIGQWPLNIET